MRSKGSVEDHRKMSMSESACAHLKGKISVRDMDADMKDTVKKR